MVYKYKYLYYICVYVYVNDCNLEDTACIQALHRGLTDILNYFQVVHFEG